MCLKVHYWKEKCTVCGKTPARVNLEQKAEVRWLSPAINYTDLVSMYQVILNKVNFQHRGASPKSSKTDEEAGVSAGMWLMAVRIWSFMVGKLIENGTNTVSLTCAGLELCQYMYFESVHGTTVLNTLDIFPA